MIRDIARRLNIPRPFLAKIVQILAKNGIVKSFKGRKGGICLGKPAGEIKLIDIVAVVDTLAVFNRCIIGFPECSDTNWCPMHETWGGVRDQIRTWFEQRSVGELGAEGLRKLADRPEQRRLVLEEDSDPNLAEPASAAQTALRSRFGK